MNKCIICEKNLGNTYSLKIKKDNTYFHTCSYNCNCKVEEKLGDDYWFYVTNKTDFIKPNVIEKVEDIDIYDFRNKDYDNDMILDGDRYDRMYEIYLENKRIDEIMEEGSNDDMSDISDDY